MCTIDQKEQVTFCFVAQAHVLKRYKLKIFVEVRDLEDRILCPRTMATYAFFAITIYSDIFFKVLEQKEED